MEWQDEGILLAARKHGEGSAIVEVFTADHGRHAGVVRGGGSRKMAALLQPGAQVKVNWRARLEDHLGTYTIEPVRSRSVEIMNDRRVLTAFGSWVSLVVTLLPEREPLNQFYNESLDLVERLTSSSDWRAHYVKWEMSLLETLGFGLELGSCAATGVIDDLCFVSPKSGRSVSKHGAKGWEDRLLGLPKYLLRNAPQDITDQTFVEGLRLTGYFLQHGALENIGRANLPEARVRLLARFNR